MKVKVFSTKGKQFAFGDILSRVTSQFEQDINHWLENNPKIICKWTLKFKFSGAFWTIKPTKWIIKIS